MSHPKLLPCPFCGSEAASWRLHNGTGDITCQGCRAGIYGNDVVARWNHRPPIDGEKMTGETNVDRNSGSTNASTAADVVLRIMGAHWDMAACRCWVCEIGRKNGLAPYEQWLSSRNGNRELLPVPDSGWGIQ